MQVQAMGAKPGTTESVGVDRSTAASPARPDAAGAVARKPESTDAAPPSAQALSKAVDSINEAMKNLSNRIEFTIDDDSKRQVVKVIDPDTREVIRQMPSEEALAIAKALDRLQGLLIKQQA